jgi:hypothetical protein
MKKNLWISVLCVTALLVAMNGCGGGKYSDVIKVNTKYVALMERYADDIDKAADAGDVIEAMNRFADGIEPLMPQMDELLVKYPELNDRDKSPKELETSLKKTVAAGEKMIITFQKVTPYLEDPEVKKAFERISSVMKMQQSP